jgi:hypothetical protein
VVIPKSTKSKIFENQKPTIIKKETTMKRNNWCLALMLVANLTLHPARAQTETKPSESQATTDRQQSVLVKLFQSYCDAIHHGDPKAAMALQSKELNSQRNLNEPLTMKLGQHVIPHRFEVLKTTIKDGNSRLKLRGWFTPEHGTKDAAGEIEAVFVQEEGAWKLQSTTFKLDSSPEEKPGQADNLDAERLKQAKGLIDKMDASLKSEIKQMVEKGERLNACKRIREATGADLLTAFEMVNIIQDVSSQ